ncbi:permease [Chengkuizengella marina]|nr:permease [Chengkuizengella marina]
MVFEWGEKNITMFQNFKTIFLSILLEAFPFILLGVLVSSLLSVFVSEKMIAKMIPKNPILGVIVGCFLGLIFPLCECGMIPIVRRLMLKGMPLYIGTVYILSGPIINPIVFASTYMAFRNQPEIAYSRMGLAFVTAFIIGLIIYKFIKINPLKNKRSLNVNEHLHIHHHHSQNVKSKFISVLAHASEEFFEMGKYLIFGALITAIIQVTVSRAELVEIGQGQWSSYLFMMGLGYILSLCSTSDAFIASSFATTFSAGSLLSFLVFGPMLDLKNTLMMLSVFKTRFIVVLSLLIFIIVLFSSIFIQHLLFA